MFQIITSQLRKEAVIWKKHGHHTFKKPLLMQKILIKIINFKCTQELFFLLYHLDFFSYFPYKQSFQANISFYLLMQKILIKIINFKCTQELFFLLYHLDFFSYFPYKQSFQANISFYFSFRNMSSLQEFPVHVQELFSLLCQPNMLKSGRKTIKCIISNRSK